jgi:hypothetical protein
MTLYVLRYLLGYLLTPAEIKKLRDWLLQRATGFTLEQIKGSEYRRGRIEGFNAGYDLGRAMSERKASER